MTLAGVLGAGPEELEERLGAPDADRTVGGDRWLVYRRPEATVRVRCVVADAGASTGHASGERQRVASWTLSWAEPRPSLRAAVEPLGLWPACEPDVDAGDVEGPLVRRRLPSPSGGAVHSLTAGLEGGGFARVAAFDEPPEWG